MKLGNLYKRLRLLPAVMVLGVTLLGLKSAGLVMEARAQETATAVPAPQTADAAPSAEAGDSAPTIPKHRPARSMSSRACPSAAPSSMRANATSNMRENLIKAAEDRVDSKIADLKSLADPNSDAAAAT